MDINKRFKLACRHCGQVRRFINTPQGSKALGGVYPAVVGATEGQVRTLQHFIETLGNTSIAFVSRTIRTIFAVAKVSSQMI